ncbi:MAG: endonuclease/exonuclease/phosphatase family protein [Candidatus Doudnabacteria bacterium]|nr:endonuclease/exonuclease/phosphatase family protein [Candidatus Doudnabacteria bacterium]
MKVISLNILGGRVFEPLKSFLTNEALDTDFFCFQEVYDSPSDQMINDGAKSNIFLELQNMLPGFKGYYEKTLDNCSGYVDVSLGLAIFAKKGIKLQSGQTLIALHEDEPPTNLQFARFEQNGNRYTLAHIHGIVNPGSKTDSADRLIQSINIDRFLNNESGKKILCGDFNLLPNTVSIELIEQASMRDLIKEFGIKTTRSDLNFAKYPAGNRQLFADYMFVSTDVNVTNFKVPKINVSDHLPLKLQLQ